MNPNINKALSRKSMRVATLFTGVAACTFTPTGNAQAAAAIASQPIGREACYSGDPNWVHLYDGPAKFSSCIGFPGTIGVPTLPWSAFCGGNNQGYLLGHTKSGVPLQQDFGQGISPYVFAFNKGRFPGGVFYISRVHITKWSGNDKCPQSYNK